MHTVVGSILARRDFICGIYSSTHDMRLVRLYVTIVGFKKLCV